ncbi:MAG TPA: FAD-dependent oxidoreductase [Thermoplasmata archaeon]|nr:FAD-dependent oxidoreductase [Thermoplasmata archaeon]
MVAESGPFDAVVLGSGESGKWLAWTLAESGQKTAVIERQYIGGSCPNIACLPSKNEIFGARVAALARRGAQYGVRTTPIAVDMAGVRERKRKMVASEVEFHLARYRAAGVDLILGDGRLVGPKELEVRTNEGAKRRVAGSKLFLDVGTHASVPDLPGLRAARPMTHIEALELDHAPGHLIVLGGGSVALELAQAARRFDAQVTVIARAPQLLAKEDPDIAEGMLQLFRDEGIEVLLNARVVGVTGRSGTAVHVAVHHDGMDRAVEGTDLLVGMGREPNTRGIGLEEAGVQLDDRGYVRVNDRLETTAPGVWAMGECAGSPQFTHVAFDDYRVVSTNLAGGDRTTRDRLIPLCLFTDPEFVRVGATKGDLRSQKVGYRVFRLPMANVLRSATTSEGRGFLKALVASDSDRILGFSAFGAEGSELLAAVQTAMMAGLPSTALRDAIFAHPTVAEGLVFLFRTPPVPGGS